MLRRLSRAALITLAVAAVAPAAAVAEQAPGGSLYCGQIDRPVTTSVLKVIVVGGGCQDAKRVVSEYLRAIDRGRCEGRGQACRMTVRKHKCSANSAQTAKRTGVALSCTRGRRTITAEDR